MEKYQGFDPSVPLNRIFEDQLDVIKFGKGRGATLTVGKDAPVKAGVLSARVVSAENAPAL